MPREIKTPWGKIITEVNLFPIFYLFFIYGFVYVTYGEVFVGYSWLIGLSEDGPLSGFNLLNTFLDLF